MGHVTGYWPGPPDLAAEVVSPNDRGCRSGEKVTSWLATAPGSWSSSTRGGAPSRSIGSAPLRVLTENDTPSTAKTSSPAGCSRYARCSRNAPVSLRRAASWQIDLLEPVVVHQFQRGDSLAETLVVDVAKWPYAPGTLVQHAAQSLAFGVRRGLPQAVQGGPQRLARCWRTSHLLPPTSASESFVLSPGGVDRPLFSTSPLPCARDVNSNLPERLIHGHELVLVKH